MLYECVEGVYVTYERMLHYLTTSCQCIYIILTEPQAIVTTAPVPYTLVPIDVTANSYRIEFAVPSNM